MATQTIENITTALAHLAVIRQATADTEIRTLCNTVTDTLAAESIVITDDVDPAAELRALKFDPFYAAIDECNAIADSSNSETVKQSCKTIVESLTSVIEKLI